MYLMKTIQLFKAQEERVGGGMEREVGVSRC